MISLENSFHFRNKNSKIKPTFGSFMSEQIPLKYQPLIERVKTKGSKSKAEAIKAFCLQCVDFKYKRVKHCSAKNCALYQVRPYQSLSVAANSGV